MLNKAVSSPAKRAAKAVLPDCLKIKLLEDLSTVTSHLKDSATPFSPCLYATKSKPAEKAAGPLECDGRNDLHLPLT